MKHQSIHSEPATAIDQSLATKTIVLRGRVNQDDMFSVMSAMSVGDILFITDRQTARNAWAMNFRFADSNEKGYAIDHQPDCYWTVERLS